MEKYRKTYLVALTISHLLLGLLAYWFGLQATCSIISACTKQLEEPIVEKWQSPSANLPFPDVHSPIYLMELANYEAFVYDALSDLARNRSNLFSPTLLTQIEDYLYIYVEDAELSRPYENYYSPDDPWWRLVGENPILSLNMISRFANELTVLCELIEEQPYISRVTGAGPGSDFIKDLIATSKWPNKYTLVEAMTGFLRLQMVYDLNVTELSTGRIFGVDTGPHISIPLMYDLGKFARSEKMYTLAVPWLELCWVKLYEISINPMHVPSKIKIKEVQDTLFATMMEHDLEHPDRLPSQYYFYKDKLLDENQNFVNPRIPLRQVDWTGVRRLNSTYNDVNYWSLCSGENHQTETEKARLSCWYDTSSNPALSIFPIKTELLSQTPYIVQMYEVIGDSAINEIINPKKLKMEKYKSTAQHAARYFPIQSNSRTSAEAFLDAGQPKLGKLIEWTTGLRALPPNSSETYLVASYAFGGHFDCHLDAVRFNEPSALNKYEPFTGRILFDDDRTTGSTGNRMATFMVYLTDTQIGGQTAFTLAGVAAKPIKGSAVFWYNLKRNGKVDESTPHCACPVVLGHKTISTKWIRLHEQFQRRPCGLNKDE